MSAYYTLLDSVPVIMLRLSQQSQCRWCLRMRLSGGFAAEMRHFSDSVRYEKPIVVSALSEPPPPQPQPPTTNHHH